MVLDSVLLIILNSNCMFCFTYIYPSFVCNSFVFTYIHPFIGVILCFTYIRPSLVCNSFFFSFFGQCHGTAYASCLFMRIIILGSGTHCNQTSCVQAT